MKWNRKYTSVSFELKPVKINNAFSFVKNKHLFLDQERVRLYGGSHVVPLHIYSSLKCGSELGPAKGFVILLGHHSWYKKDFSHVRKAMHVKNGHLFAMRFLTPRCYQSLQTGALRIQ